MLILLKISTLSWLFLTKYFFKLLFLQKRVISNSFRKGTLIFKPIFTTNFDKKPIPQNNNLCVFQRFPTAKTNFFQNRANIDWTSTHTWTLNFSFLFRHKFNPSIGFYHITDLNANTFEAEMMRTLQKHRLFLYYLSTFETSDATCVILLVFLKTFNRFLTKT